MLDIKLLKSNPKELEKKLQTKDPEISLKPVIDLYDAFCLITQDLEKKQSEMNQTAKLIGEKKRNGESTDTVIQQLSDLKKAIGELSQKQKRLQQEYIFSLSKIPNIPMEDVKPSLDPKDNVCIKTVGKKPHFSFPFKNHLELNDQHHLFDFPRGAKIAGSGWPVYRGFGAKLEWALLQLMVDTALSHDFTYILPPLLAGSETLYGAGQLPKFEDQLFKIKDEDFHLYLLPTAEVALNALHLDEMLKEEDLPKKYLAYTPCFRREAGAAGKNERGLIRMHQFNKVEMFCFTHPDESNKMFEHMLEIAEEILQKLELHYRSMLLVTGDMSFPAAKTVDIEAWLPGQDRYYEVSSVSNCTDYQARRSKIRFKDKNKKTTFVHTLNGSALATSRLMVALLENHQQEDGSIYIPKALQPYLGNIALLEPTTEVKI